jgi:hypothetical protein
MTAPGLKQYLGISRDHSASMREIDVAAARDYNSNIAVIKEESAANNMDTIVSVVKCGVGPRALIERETVNSNVSRLVPLIETKAGYAADGHATPLYDSVVDLVSIMKSVPDYDDISVSFMVMAITDGVDNYSKTTGKALGAMIKDLQATDRWTFVFRVPVGYASELAKHGIPRGNILEWNQTEKGVEQASAQTAQAMKTFYAERAAGKTSSTTFYSNLSEVSVEEIKAALVDISAEVSVWPVGAIEAGSEIRDFVEKRLKGSAMIKGGAFYQLTKTEKAVQDYKKIVIRDQKKGTVYGGAAARQMLGLPTSGDVRLKPGDHGDFDVFIQSTSTNRKLTDGSSLLYWPQAEITK